MKFKERAVPREHMRCLLCGKLGAIAVDTILPSTFRDNHELHVLVQSWPVGGGFSWSGRPMLRDEMIALRGVLSAVVERLNHAIREE